MIQCPEQGQPAVGIRGIQAGQMGGMHHEDGMELEAYRARLDVADARQQQGREYIAVGQVTPLDAGSDLLQQLVPGSLLKELYEGFDFRGEPHRSGVDLRFLSGHLRQPSHERETGLIDQGAGPNDRLQKAAAGQGGKHGAVLLPMAWGRKAKRPGSRACQGGSISGAVA